MRRLSGLAWWVACVIALSVGAAVAAAGQAQGSGRFEHQGSWFNVGGAYAFPSRVGMGEGEGIKVAISNAGFVAEGLDRYWDREAYIDATFPDENTLVAYLHFDGKGKYLGASWYFGPGSGCGFCSSSDAVSTVKVAGGRIAGNVRFKDEDTTYDVTFDVPVAPKLPGEALAADGGEPGQAYMAYHSALTAGDEATVMRLMNAQDRDRYAQAKQEGHDVMAYLESEHPKELKIVRAFRSGDFATLLFRGEASWGSVHGEAQMKLENGAWVFWDENVGVGDWLEGRQP